MVLRKDVIAGMCLWIDRRWSSGFFMSDELFDFLTEGKVFKELIGPPGTFVGGGKRTKLISWEVFTE